MHDLVCPDRHLDDALAAMERFEKAPVRGLALPELRRLLEKLGRLDSAAAAGVCRVTVEVDAETGGARAAGVLQEATGMSKREANRTARTAKGLDNMPNTAGRLADGDITIEHARVLVDTAREAGAEAVDNNTGLLDRAGQAPSDLFAQEAKQYAAEVCEDRGEPKLHRQRKARRASLWEDSASGMGRLSADFDPVTFGLIRESVEGHAAMLRRGDLAGTAGSDPERTGLQRLADAIAEGLTGLDALTCTPIAPRIAGNNRSNSGKGGVGDRSGPGRGCDYPRLVVVADIGLIDGTDPNGRCEIPGTGPVPPSILERLSPDTRLAGMIFAGDGKPLWLGGSRRGVSDNQRLAVAVRDRGCVKCGAPMHQCEIHHMIPWEHDGPTDIDNLQALCGQHHRQHHEPYSPTNRRPGRADSPQPPPGHDRSHDNGDPLNGRLLM